MQGGYAAGAFHGCGGIHRLRSGGVLAAAYGV